MEEIKPDKSLELDAKELKFFYKNLQLCECRESLTGYNFNSKELKDFIESKGIKIVYNKEQGKAISKSSEDNEIQLLCYGKLGVCPSLFKHLRNAFAHCYIEKDMNTGILHFQNRYRGAIRMDGKMKFNVLKALVEKMLQTKK